MEIKEIKNKQEWEEINEKGVKFNNFAQSWDWGEILKKDGHRVLRLAVSDGDQMVAKAQIRLKNLFFGRKYAFSPQGPIIFKKERQSEIYSLFLSYLKQKKIVFWRIEPPVGKIEGLRGLTKVKDTNPRTTTMLNLDGSEEEILAKMKPKTRYNIRLAQKKGLKISFKKDIDAFLRLEKETASRDGFRLHEEKHYRHIIESPLSSQISVEFEGRIIAVNIYVVDGSIFTYLYGASDYRFRSLMAPYLAQWEGIKKAKEAGFKKYDFFGIASKSGEGEYDYDVSHQYAGITKFKLGFGGEVFERAGTFDLKINRSLYFLYLCLRKGGRLLKAI